MGRLLNTSTELDGNLTQALKSLEQGTAGIIAESRFLDINKTLQRYAIKIIRFATFDMLMSLQCFPQQNF